MIFAAPGIHSLCLENSKSKKEIGIMFENDQMKNEKNPIYDGAETNEEQEMTRTQFKQSFVDRLDEAFQDTVVNVEFETDEDSVKKVIGATLTRIGSNYIELTAPTIFPFTVLTFISGVATPVDVQFVRSIIINGLTRIISIERA